MEVFKARHEAGFFINQRIYNANYLWFKKFYAKWKLKKTKGIGREYTIFLNYEWNRALLSDKNFWLKKSKLRGWGSNFVQILCFQR